MSIVLELRKVSFNYGYQEVLREADLIVRRGDFLGVVGLNGSGKTTLIKIALGLLKPNSGNIMVFGRDIASFRDWPKIGYVSQKTNNMDDIFPATAWEVVLSGRSARAGLFRRLKSRDREAAADALKIVGMSDEKDLPLKHLSGGQQQRVFIARALAAGPELLIMDEPTAGVDLPAQEKLCELLERLNREMGLTIILVSHDLALISKHASRIAYLNGNITCYRSPEEFFARSGAFGFYRRSSRYKAVH
jgi:zinc transport system ATP-binding protein